MLVIRVRHPDDNHGIYTSDHGPADLVADMQEISGAHPRPMDDSLIAKQCKQHDVWHEKFNYGFTNWQQFRAWFYKDDWIKQALAAGFEICVFDIDEVFVGHTQCLWFIVEEPKLIRAFDDCYFIEEIHVEVEKIYLNQQDK